MTSHARPAATDVDGRLGAEACWDVPAGAGGIGSELRAAHMVLKREMLHFVRDRARSAVVLLQPLLFLFVLGVGLSRLIEAVGGVSAQDYLIFLFPGVLVMSVQAPAISVGASIVWDRQSGFLREMLVAPVRRSTLLIGKCVGGGCVAMVQGLWYWPAPDWSASPTTSTSSPF